MTKIYDVDILNRYRALMDGNDAVSGVSYFIAAYPSYAIHETPDDPQPPISEISFVAKCSAPLTITVYDEPGQKGNSETHTYNGKGIDEVFNPTIDVVSFSIDKSSADALQEFTIGSGVTNIDDYAFSGCTNMLDITIPDSVSGIGSESFRDCVSMLNLTVGVNITSISKGAFMHTPGLTSITVAEGNTVYDSRNDCNGVVDTKTKTLIIGCQNSIIDETLNYVGEYAFYECTSLTSVTWPQGVMLYGDYIFEGCDNVKVINTNEGEFCPSFPSVTDVIYGDDVTYLGDYVNWGEYCPLLSSITFGSEFRAEYQSSAFGYCQNLARIVVDENNPYVDSRNNCNALIRKHDEYSEDKNILLLACKNTIIPNDIEHIDNQAFKNITGITNLTIPDSVTTIRDAAFSDMQNLMEITFGTGLTSLGGYVISDTSVSKITCKAITAPTLNYTFGEFSVTNGTLYIPNGSDESYQTWLEALPEGWTIQHITE